MAAEGAFLLPYSIATVTALNQLVREAETIDEALRQGSSRQGGAATVLPKASMVLNELLETNQMNLLHEADRQQLLASLRHLQANAPSLHISFSTDPSPAFTRKLIIWMRGQIHPHLLLRIGLQPSIGVGCVVRTANKTFDLSLRERFRQHQDLLVKQG